LSNGGLVALGNWDALTQNNLDGSEEGKKKDPTGRLTDHAVVIHLLLRRLKHDQAAGVLLRSEPVGAGECVHRQLELAAVAARRFSDSLQTPRNPGPPSFVSVTGD
jgi:hypothetical protein